jgi:phenylacetate-CoA ligase
MGDTLLHVYHRLPSPLRSAAATIRGYHLKSCRYGPETDEWVRAALDRESWSPTTWAAWREARLGSLLHRAATTVPHYRDMWARRRRAGDKASWEELSNWPVLSKDELRADPRAFVAEGVDPRGLYNEHTSGSTGTPVSLWIRRETVRRWYALCEARLRRWNGVGRDERWAMIGGQLVVPFARTRPPFWVWNRAMRQLYLSSYHLSPANASPFIDAMSSYSVHSVVGYASSLYTLARAALEMGLQPPPLEVALSNAEPLFEHQRATIAAGLGCPVRDTYGMCEICCAASECEFGSLHLWPEAGVLEVLDDDGDTPVRAGRVGRFVCTGLLNEDMPLVRYEVGDRGALSPPGVACRCGRTLPTIAGVEGRCDDTLLTRDGRRVGRLDPVFKADIPIYEAQIVQETLDRVRVRLVPADGYRAEHGMIIARRLRDRLGDVEVVPELVARIPRSANGKFRAVVCQLDREAAAEHAH